MKIMIINDSIVDQESMSNCVSHLGHDIVLASSGHSALEMYFQETPDLVFVDARMADMDGFETVRRLRRMEEDWCPILFLSADVNDELFVKGIAAGADDYLAKPIDIKVLEAKLIAMQRIMDMRSQLLETTDELKIINERMLRRSQQDGLTGLANRGYLDEVLERELKRAIRNRSLLSILLIDIDHFKQFNDERGHLVGDDVLRQTATMLSNHLSRPADFIGRYGGEEFCVILPDTDKQGAMAVAQRLQTTIATMSEEDGENIGITISTGVSSQIPMPTCTRSGMIEPADRALYQAKKNGRNCVSYYGADDEPQPLKCVK